MQELWQLYHEDGTPKIGVGAVKDNVLKGALLHGAAHVWIWRARNQTIEVLLQKRSATKRTWPNRFDISTAGHINLDELPHQAAVRETAEEIGITVQADQLQSLGIHKTYLDAGNGNIENEFQWLYLLEFDQEVDFVIQESEVSSLQWVSLDDFKISYNSATYVPHDKAYYEKIINALKSKEHA